MATHTMAGTTPSVSNFSMSHSYPQPSHIDLTLDEDDDADDSYNSARYAKRQRTDATPNTSFSQPSLGHSNPLTPTRTMNSFTSLNQKPALSMPDTSRPTSIPDFGSSSYPSNPYKLAPNTSSPSFTFPTAHVPQQQPHPPRSSYPSLSHARSSGNSGPQIIDLTDSPSPPPQTPPLSAHSLPPDLSPRTPVCIGQLQVNGLILYRSDYLRGVPTSGEVQWGPVRLQYEHTPQAGCDTIHIKTPYVNSPNDMGEETFGIVEQKVAAVIAPLIGKGLVRISARIRLGAAHDVIQPLRMLFCTPKGNIPAIGNYFREHRLLLDHPSFPFDFHSIAQHYHNPHNPPPGGHNPAHRLGYGVVNNIGRWSTPVSGKSVEVQRSHVEGLFRTFKSGDELPETDSPPEVATRLYSHQKKALTFLLEREREKPGPDGKFSSLWQSKTHPMTRRPCWIHVITDKEVFEEPREARGSILADDMGLGKTITCISLIAATLQSAKCFAAVPLEPVTAPPQIKNDIPEASHFAGSVWGMPDVAEGSISAKAKAKAEREQNKLEVEYIRACRIKAKSRATLIICPLSTVANWEDQFREHWKGEVTVVGGSGGCLPTPTPLSSQSSSQGDQPQNPINLNPKPEVRQQVREGTPLRVYVYHGNARRPDPSFLADFDAVITTYATLASEFSKQNRTITNAEAEEEEEDITSDYGGVDIDENGNEVLRLPKPKKPSLKRRKGNGISNNVESSSALQSIHWFRVVLDEAHSIKETGTVGSRASCDLMADRRLCLTGTPVQNKLDDVFALIKFLRLEPFNDKNIWTEFIGSPVKFGQALGVARLQTIMSCITLRRTKESKAEDGKKILSLPPRHDEIRFLKFDQGEQAIYDQFYNQSKAEFNDLSSKNEVMKNYVGILQKILRLRQICDHFELVQGKGQSQDPTASYEEIVAAISKEGINVTRATAIFAMLKESATTQCVECGCELCTSLECELVDTDAPTTSQKRGRKAKGPTSRGPTRTNSPATPRPVMTRCQHLFCIECYRNCICPGWPNVPSESILTCSACQAGFSPSDAVEIKPECSAPEQSSKKKNVRRDKRQKPTSLDNYHPSTKVKALLSDLIQFSKANPYSVNYDPSSIEVQMIDDQGNDLDDGIVKTVVFSQWTSMLDKIEDALEDAGIRYDRLDGTMKRDERSRAMDALKNDPSCEVLLVSLKAGGVGLNLTAAQRVYLMDPYWNPAVENQAVDRIHRLGQTRPVTTIRLIIENSIEDRLLQVQKEKTKLAKLTLGKNYTKAELARHRQEELAQLFNS